MPGRPAFITGAANGIGEGIATSLAQFGAHIVIAAIDGENGERVATAIRELGREALFIETGVNNTDQISRAMEAVAARFGRLDILVNNAGGVRKQSFMKQSERSWRKHIDFNFISMLSATQAGAELS